MHQRRNHKESGAIENIPLTRLNSYLKAAYEIKQAGFIRIEDLLTSLGDITKSQVIKDCEDLGVSWHPAIPIYDFSRCIRKTIRKLRLSLQTFTLHSAEIPIQNSFLEMLSGYTDTQHGQRAEIIESSYAYSAEFPEYFLLAHGIFKKNVRAYRHQVKEAIKIVERMHGNSIVVHEVGLGKTITAILVLCELLLREPKLNSLILTPSNLLKQWYDEIKKCVDIPVYAGYPYIERTIDRSMHVLMPIDTAKQERWAEILNTRLWGLLIVDEGHVLRNEDTARYRFIYSLRAKRRLLLTATPVHNSGYDIFHQVNIIRPGYFGRKTVFGEYYMRDERQIHDPVYLQERLKYIVSRRKRSETDLTLPKRDIAEILVRNRTSFEKRIYNDILKFLRGVYRRHLGSAAFLRRPSGKEQGVSQIVLVSILVLRELASHPLSALKTMCEALYNRVYRFSQVTHDTTDLDRLEKFKQKYSNLTWQIGNHSKTEHLIKALPALVDQYGRVIIYVEFRETQKILVKRLKDIKKVGLPHNAAVISYHGSLSIAEKVHQEERFNKNKYACFISTDAGGQGLNLQAGCVVINFDFPWNPMRVEQRIGRVDRIGQKSSNVIVKNFQTSGTIEQYVYLTLRKKLKVCEDVLGNLVPRIFNIRGINQSYCTEGDVLGIGQIILSSQNDHDLRHKFLTLEQNLEDQILRQSKAWQPGRRWIDE